MQPLKLYEFESLKLIPIQKNVNKKHSHYSMFVLSYVNKKKNYFNIRHTKAHVLVEQSIHLLSQNFFGFKNQKSHVPGNSSVPGRQLVTLGLKKTAQRHTFNHPNGKMGDPQRHFTLKKRSTASTSEKQLLPNLVLFEL